MSFIVLILMYEAIVVGAAGKEVFRSELQELILRGHLEILTTLKSKKIFKRV
ncbi:MAG: hypothetical protein ACTSWL_01830 [Promethearchaeota archaeon]